MVEMSVRLTLKGPFLIQVIGYLRAQQQGINLISNPAAILGEEEDNDELEMRIRQAAWLDYGKEAYRKRPGPGPQDKDPNVQVPDVLEGTGEGVGDYLASPAVQEEMAQLAGAYWPIPRDYGVSRYKLVRDRTYQLVIERFPDYLAG